MSDVDLFFSGRLYIDSAPAENVCCRTDFVVWGGEGGFLPYMGYIAMCNNIGYGFVAVWPEIVPILAMLVSNTVWFLYFSLALGMFFRIATFSLLLIRELKGCME